MMKKRFSNHEVFFVAEREIPFGRVEKKIMERPQFRRIRERLSSLSVLETSREERWTILCCGSILRAVRSLVIGFSSSSSIFICRSAVIKSEPLFKQMIFCFFPLIFLHFRSLNIITTCPLVSLSFLYLFRLHDNNKIYFPHSVHIQISAWLQVYTSVKIR